MTAVDTVPDKAIAVSASFTAEGLEAPLAFMLDAAGLAIGVRSAPYNQVFQELLAPGSMLGANTGGVNVVLARVQDFIGEYGTADGTTAAALAERVDRVRVELVDAVRHFMQRSATPLVVAMLPSSPGLDPVVLKQYDDAHAEVEVALASISGVLVMAPQAVDALCAGERFDADADRLAHIPFTDEYIAALAIALARRTHLLTVPARKVLVLDCDNTLWGGVVGEDGVDGITLAPGFLAVQRFAVEAQLRGVLVCLASKNAEHDVLEVLAQRPDMLLKAEHVVSHRINWEHKPGNVASLAQELNLGLDAFVFVDDNPVECGQMREALPEVVTLQLPPSAEAASFLDHLWAFDKPSVTQEDQRRTAMYRENAARDSFESQAGDIGAFIAALELVIDIGAPCEAEWPRVAQLTHRTNQFNFTTRRRSETEMRAAAAGGTTVLAVQVRDRFGDYGLVGVVAADAVGDALVVETFLLSCRVLGRGVEHRIVAELGRLAHERGLASVCLPYRKTSKNEPARAFADSVLAAHRHQRGDGGDLDYVVPARAAAAVSHRPGEDAAEVVEARRNDGKKKPAPTASSVAGRSAAYVRLAAELTSGERLIVAMQRAASRQRDLPAPAVAANNDEERDLLTRWERLLGVSGLGIDDDYFALGGTSLQAARLFADIARSHGVQLPMTTILEAPTPRALAARIAGGANEREGNLIALKTGGSRNLFLVHDGDGETLLYRNLAQLAPAGVSVFGIAPVSAAGIPLVHARIEDMAAAYVASVRRRQPAGPFLLGGMCAGGLIAFEMARQLERAGETVEHVILMDTATPQAARKRWRGGRAANLGQRLRELRAGRSAAAAAPVMAGLIAKKLWGGLSYEVTRAARRLSNAARVALAKRVVARGAAWPPGLPSLDFRTLYVAAEEQYQPVAGSHLPTLLLRATSGEGGDVPFREVYDDPSFGWLAVVDGLRVVDVAGGHAGMLQEPHVRVLAESLESVLAPRAQPAASHCEPAHA